MIIKYNAGNITLVTEWNEFKDLRKSLGDYVPNDESVAAEFLRGLRWSAGKTKEELVTLGQSSVELVPVTWELGTYKHRETNELYTVGYIFPDGDVAVTSVSTGIHLTLKKSNRIFYIKVS